MNSRTWSSIQSSLVAITICAIVQVIAQVLFQVALAKNFGATREVDSFSAALAIPTVLISILTSSIGYIMVPLLVPLNSDNKKSSQSNEEEFRQVALAVGLWSIGLCALASLILWIYASPIVNLLYVKFSTIERQLTTGMLQILAPIVVLSAIQGWLQGIDHSRQNFLRPALANAIGPSVVTMLLFIPIAWERPIYWIASCLLLGTLAAIVLLLPAIRFGIPARWKTPPATLIAIRRSIPLLAFNSYTKLDPIVDRVLLAGLTVGAISHLNYAQRFVTALILIASSGVSTMAFSDLAGAKTGDFAHFCSRLYENLRRMILVVMPVTIGLFFFSSPSIKTLLERGQFTSQDTTQVAILLIGLIGFFIASAVGDLIAKAYYAFGDTKTPSIIGALAFTCGMGFKVLGVNYWGVWGLAISTSVYTFLSVCVMLFILGRRLKMRNFFQELFPTTLRSMAASILGSLIASVILWSSLPSAWWIAVFLGAITYAIFLLALKDSTWRKMVLRNRRHESGLP